MWKSRKLRFFWVTFVLTAFLNQEKQSAVITNERNNSLTPIHCHYNKPIYWKTYLGSSEVTIFRAIDIQIILHTFIKYTLGFAAALILKKLLQEKPKFFIDILTYWLNDMVPLDLSKQVAYCMNSSWQLFFTLRKKFKAQLVTAFPSLIHALGSSNSWRHNINSYTTKNINKLLLLTIVMKIEVRYFKTPKII